MDSERYRARKRPLFPLPDDPSDERPVWQQAGFDSFEDYLDEIEAINRRNNGLPPLPPEPVDRPRQREGPGRSYQVGLRLAVDDYDRLIALARENGVAPGTMAKMLVVRGVRRREANPRAG